MSVLHRRHGVFGPIGQLRPQNKGIFTQAQISGHTRGIENCYLNQPDELSPCSEQALLTGLSIVMPHDPWEFVLEKLQKLKDSGGSAVLHWSANFLFQYAVHFQQNYDKNMLVYPCRDMFVDASMKPPRLHRGMLDALMDETDLVISSPYSCSII